MPPIRRGMSDAQARVAGDSMPDRRQREDTAAIRVSNLSENVQEADLQVRITQLSQNKLSIMLAFLTRTNALGTV